MNFANLGLHLNCCWCKCGRYGIYVFSLVGNILKQRTTVVKLQGHFVVQNDSNDGYMILLLHFPLSLS